MIAKKSHGYDSKFLQEKIPETSDDDTFCTGKCVFLQFLFCTWTYNLLTATNENHTLTKNYWSKFINLQALI